MRLCRWLGRSLRRRQARFGRLKLLQKYRAIRSAGNRLSVKLDGFGESALTLQGFTDPAPERRIRIVSRKRGAEVRLCFGVALTVHVDRANLYFWPVITRVHAARQAEPEDCFIRVTAAAALVDAVRLTTQNKLTGQRARRLGIELCGGAEPAQRLL